MIMTKKQISNKEKRIMHTAFWMYICLYMDLSLALCVVIVFFPQPTQHSKEKINNIMYNYWSSNP